MATDPRWKDEHMTQHEAIPVEAILAVLIDRAGGTITLSYQDLHRIADMKPEFEFSPVEDFSDDAIRLRYRDHVTIEGQIAPGAADDNAD